MPTTETAKPLGELPSPSLLLDRARFDANIRRMQARADRLGVHLRPHLKTLKSAAAARALLAAGARGITVSTLKEAAYFLEHGITDITYAVGMLPVRLPAAAALIARGAELTLLTDNLEVAGEIIAAAGDSPGWRLLVEIDCGDGRGGLRPDDAALRPLVEAIDRSALRFAGFLTHAGHSYAVDRPAEIAAIAAAEREAVLSAAALARAAGIEAETLSVGSTPTALFAEDLAGITELRAGVYTVFDLDQQSRGVCALGDIALSVLTRVIGHNRPAGKLLIDAGGLALSKDRSADRFRPEVGYGQLCRLDGEPIDGLYVDSVSQEHGHVGIREGADFDRFPVGTALRVLPVHACMTAAAYDAFELVDGELSRGRWQRVNGW